MLKDLNIEKFVSSYFAKKEKTKESGRDFNREAEDFLSEKIEDGSIPFGDLAKTMVHFGRMSPSNFQQEINISMFSSGGVKPRREEEPDRLDNQSIENFLLDQLHNGSIPLKDVAAEMVRFGQMEPSQFEAEIEEAIHQEVAKKINVVKPT